MVGPKLWFVLGLARLLCPWRSAHEFRDAPGCKGRDALVHKALTLFDAKAVNQVRGGTAPPLALGSTGDQSALWLEVA
ncbi:MAG: hypothetical protein AAF709_10880 [Pseudomonadota bacterium]